MDVSSPSDHEPVGESSQLPKPPDLPPPPIGRPVGQPKNHLRWLIIGVAVVVIGAFAGAKVYSSLSTSPTLTMQDVATSTVDVGKAVKVTNPIDLGLTSITVTKVVRGVGATAIVGQPQDATHERVALEMLVCADARFRPNGTAAIWLETTRGAQIFPDPSTAANSLLNATFGQPRCRKVILGYTLKNSQKLRHVTYGQFPYRMAHWKIPASSIGSTS